MGYNKDLKIEYALISELKEYENNARVHSEEKDYDDVDGESKNNEVTQCPTA